MIENQHTSTTAIKSDKIFICISHQTYSVTLSIPEPCQLSTKILPQVQKADARHYHEECSDQNATGKGQHAIPVRSHTGAFIQNMTEEIIL